MSRLRLLLGALAAAGALVAAACDPEGSPAMPTVEPPSAFDATVAISTDAASDASVDSTLGDGGDAAADAMDGSVDTGAPEGPMSYPPFTCGGGDASTDADAEAAVDAGATDGCAVSWTNDLFPSMQAGNIYDCASALCHGAAIPGRPAIDTTDAATTYQNFASFHVVDAGDLPVILPGSADPSQSVLECVLRRTCLRPMPPGNYVLTGYLAKIDAWICCGAPLN